MPNPEFEHQWNYTRSAKDEFGPTFKDRPLIGRDMDIRGGVYYGTYGGEAIVVDPLAHPEEYGKYYDKAASLASSAGQIQRYQVLRAVFNTVSKEMPYSKSGVNKLLSDIAMKKNLDQFMDGDKVELSTFMAKKVGVCRHQALASAATLLRFKDEGYIRGEVSIDRNIRWNPENDQVDGHAWVRYTAHDGEVYILDVAHYYLGPLKKTLLPDRWNYMRPEEPIKRSSNLGRAIIQSLEDSDL